MSVLERAAVPLLDRATAPLDALRRLALRRLSAVPAAARLLADRDRRVLLIATTHALAAFVVATLAPVLLLLLGPIFLGVAHAAADLRYLVLRRALSHWWRRTVLGACLALIAWRALDLVDGVDGFRIEVLLVVGWGLLAVVAAAQARGDRASRRRTVLATVAVLGVGATALSFPVPAQRALIHLHNWVGWSAWLLLFRSGIRSMWLPASLTLGAAALLASGALASLTLAAGSSSLGLDVLSAASWVAPGLDAEHAIGLTCAYVLMQSIHYATWLYFVPQQELSGQAPVTFRRSVRSLLDDFGALGLGLIVLGVLGVLGSATQQLQRTRTAYLTLATFHVHLELVMVTYFWVAGGIGPRAPGRSRAKGAS